MVTVLVIAVNNYFMSHCVIVITINSLSPVLRSLFLSEVHLVAKFSSGLPQNNNLSVNRENK